jgi:branched-chain amino acid transport system permease protein
MEIALNLLLDGLARGSIFGIIALGYTMVYGVIKLINFAHGEFFMAGAFAGYFFIHALPLEKIPLPWPWDSILVFTLAALVAALASTGVALLAEFCAYRPLRSASKISLLLTTLGVSLLLQNGFLKTFGSETKSFPDPRKYVNLSQFQEGQILEDTYYTQTDSGDSVVVLSKDEKFVLEKISSKFPHGLPEKVYSRVFLSKTFKRVFSFVMLLIVTSILIFLVHKSKLGIAMRAASQNRMAAKLMGININHIVVITFVVGATLAGMGGVIHGLYYTTVHPYMGFMPGVKAFVASVLGGIGSIPGAVLGSLLIGVLEVFAEGVGFSAYRDILSFLLLILFLVFRPQGIFGKEGGEKI